MTSYITHTALESRKVTPAVAKKYDGSGDLGDMVQQYLVQLKYDGCCGVLVNPPDAPAYLLTRTGERVENFDHILNAFNALPFDTLAECRALGEDESYEWVMPEQLKTGVYFGEFWNPDFAATTIGGFLNLVSQEKIAERAEDIAKVQFVVNDFVTFEEWLAGKSVRNFEARIACIDWMQAILTPDECKARGIEACPPVWFCGHEGTVAEQAATSLDDLAKEAKAAGRYDGVILRSSFGTWEKGARNCAVIKVKPTLTVDVIVTGYELGKGKYSKCIGKIHYEYKGQTGKCSGMTDAQRGIGMGDTYGTLEEFFCGEWFGKTIEVEAMEESKHGLLREPRFKRFREGADRSVPE